MVTNPMPWKTRLCKDCPIVRTYKEFQLIITLYKNKLNQNEFYIRQNLFWGWKFYGQFSSITANCSQNCADLVSFMLTLGLLNHPQNCLHVFSYVDIYIYTWTIYHIIIKRLVEPKSGPPPSTIHERKKKSSGWWERS